jgi:hypothetical protein
MTPFVIVFLLAGIGLLIAGRKVQGDASRAVSWPTVPAELEQCEVAEVPGLEIKDVSNWRLRVRYSYVVEGKTYRSTRYAFGYGDGHDEAKHRKVVEELKGKPQLLVHYDPEQHSEAVISTEVQRNLTSLGYAGLVVAVIAAVIGFAT